MSSIAATSNPDAKFANRGAVANAGSRSTKTNPGHAMIAGYLAGSSGTIVGFPLETLKVWYQTGTLGKNQHLERNVQKKNKKRGPKRPKESARQMSSCGKSRSSKSSKTTTTTNNSCKVYGARRSNSTTAMLYSSSSTSSSHKPAAATLMPPRAAGAVNKYVVKPATTMARTVRALYSGVLGPLVTVGMVQSVNFATYNATRQWLYAQQHPNCDPRDYLTQDSLRNVAMAGSVGGMATAVLTAPLLMMKINQQITGDSFRRSFRNIFLVETSKGHFAIRPLRPYGAAFVPHAMSEAIGRCIYVSSYEGFKRSLLESKNSQDASVLSLRERMLCAAGSGILCWGTFFPLDALRNNMYHATQMRTTQGSGLQSILHTMKGMHQEKAFYRGFSISMVRAGPVAASVLPVYDLTLEWLSSK